MTLQVQRGGRVGTAAMLSLVGVLAWQGQAHLWGVSSQSGSIGQTADVVHTVRNVQFDALVASEGRYVVGAEGDAWVYGIDGDAVQLEDRIGGSVYTLPLAVVDGDVVVAEVRAPNETAEIALTVKRYGDGAITAQRYSVDVEGSDIVVPAVGGSTLVRVVAPTSIVGTQMLNAYEIGLSGVTPLAGVPTSDAVAVAMSGDYVYTLQHADAASVAFLVVYQLTSGQLNQVGTTTLPVVGSGLKIIDDRVYNFGDGIVAVDVSQPYAPQLLPGRIENPAVKDVAAEDDWIVAVYDPAAAATSPPPSAERAVGVAQVTNGSLPQSLTSVWTDHPVSLAVDGEYVYVVDRVRGLLGFDFDTVNVAMSPVFDEEATRSHFEDAIGLGTDALAAYDAVGGLRLYELGPTGAVTETNGLPALQDRDLTGGASLAAIDDGLFLATTDWYSVVGLTATLSPTLEAQAPWRCGTPSKVAVRDGTVFVECGDEGVQVIDVTVLDAPVVATPVGWGERLSSFALEWPLFVSAHNPGMVRVWDATGAPNMVQVGVAMVGHPCAFIELAGSYGYCVSSGGTLSVLDLTTPASPLVVWSKSLEAPVSGNVMYATTIDDQLLLALNGSGIVDVAISDPEQPAVDGVIVKPGFLNRLHPIGGGRLVGSFGGGFGVYEDVGGGGVTVVTTVER